MIIVTEQAKDFFCGIQHPEDKVVCLDLARNDALQDRPGAKRVRVTADEPRNDDQVVPRGGEEVLRIPGAVGDAFDGCVMRRVETPEGVGFSIARPEAGRDAAS